MGIFLDREKNRQTEFKLNSPFFSSEARADGMYKGKPRPFCLRPECAHENLFPEIRQPAIQFFTSHGIKWHDGQDGKPSNHLCSSQVCCVNFLFPLSDKPEELKDIFTQIYPEIERMVPVEDGRYVSFEWIGERNYLNEKTGRTGKRTRGANFTSADAVVIFDRQDGKRQMVLIEWKYTEAYGSSSLKFAASGTDRTRIYEPLFLLDDCPFKKDLLPGFDALFYEPFYQFMRQQLLAHEMEKAHEMGADVVSVLHIAPAANTDFHKVTSPGLVELGDTAVNVWKNLLATEHRFVSVNTEDLFADLNGDALPRISSWIVYVHTRYEWLTAMS